MLHAIHDRRVVPVASWALADEIVRVLRRQKLRRYGITASDVSDVLALLAPFLPTVEFDVPTRDPRDRPVVVAALTGEAEAIVTGDRDLLDDRDLHRRLADQDIRVLIPREVLSSL